jgi:hypothetical protein
MKRVFSVRALVYLVALAISVVLANPGTGNGGM